MKRFVFFVVLLWSVGAAAQQYGEQPRAPSPSGSPEPPGAEGPPPPDSPPPPGAPVVNDPAAPPPEQLPPPPPEPLPPAAQRPGEPVPGTPTIPPKTDGPNVISVLKDERGYALIVDGRPTMVFGMNWGYMPIGENYTYDFWNKPDEIIIEALHGEMTLLQEMGVNLVRQYIGVPPRWIKYIYEKYGIFTALNHSIGRYGMTIDGVWVNPIDYSDPKFRDLVKQEMRDLVAEYKDTPGLMMWVLGNENNYGLYWKSNEIEDLPEEKQGDARAVFLYSLFGEITDEIHAEDPNHPVVIANGDVGFIDVIAEQCPNIDIFGSNVYRGASSRDIFLVVDQKLGRPFMYTEFGADAFDAKRGIEDQITQAQFLQAQWQEIYEQSYGKGRVGNAIGGMIFQWSDGWWKYKQEVNLDKHDTNASWANKAYPNDYVEGQNNMNEEWFGITSKGKSNARGIYSVYPRAAYYVLQDAFKLDPYAPDTDIQKIREHFARTGPRMSADTMTKLAALERFRPILRVDFDTYTTGGRQLNIPEREETRFDHTESFYFGFEVKPTQGVRADIVVNGLGNVATNPINEIFYENRGIPTPVRDPDGEIFALTGINRFQVYEASFDWDNKYFLMEAFWRGTGHYHWGYEGDFFHLYPEVHQQFDIDTYNANAPVGVTFSGKDKIDGLKIAFGPQLWWGANPTILAKYYRVFGDFKFAVLHQEDIAQQTAEIASSAIPQPKARKSTLYFGWAGKRLNIEAGGITSRSNFIGDSYEIARQANGPTYLDSGYYIADGRVNFADTLGGRVKMTLSSAPVFWYIQGSYMGLVSDAGADQTTTLTGWSMKESGQGNHWAVSTGLAYYINKVMLGPNFLIQRPIEGPLPFIQDRFDPDTGTYFPGVQGRNQLVDPFWVRSNRETYGFELLLGWDPTPATPMYAWDNAQREDAITTVALDFVYRILPTSQDAAVAINQDLILFAFPTGAPAKNLWDVSIRTISNFRYNMRLVNWIYAGQGQANGDDSRTVTRYGLYGWFTYSSFNINYHFKFDDWGPYDYHKDFNLTFPVQVLLDLSYAYEPPALYAPAATRFGVQGQVRTLDRFSNRYRFDPMNPNATGVEWEIKTYVQFAY